MQNIFSYLKENRNKSFNEVKFNEIDNVIFSSISYSDFKDIISEDKNPIKLHDALKQFLNKYNLKDISKYGIAQRDSYKIIKEVVNCNRYKDVIVYGYQYVGDNEKQFCAMTFKVRKKFTYIAFEGTDHLISGWKEDFEMVYKFPVSAQESAIAYLNEYVSIFDKHLMIGGHSKGGNLALVAAMFCNPLIRSKIRKIYNNDGPGLRKREIESIEYKIIEKKIELIIPNYSLVGLLLRHSDNYTVIKSSKKDMMAHSVLTWIVDGNHFKKEKLSELSKKLDESIILWLDDHDDAKREKMITTVFKTLEDAKIYNLYDLKSIKNAIKVIKNLNKIDKETKDLVYDFLSFNLNYIIRKKRKVS